MTVLANTIEAPMQVLGLSCNEATERVLELFSMLSLADKCNHFARALATRPNVMPFDEVTFARDRKLCSEEHNLTMRIVTHQVVFLRVNLQTACASSRKVSHRAGTAAAVLHIAAA